MSQWGWQSGRKAGYEAGESKDKLERMKTNQNLHLALTTSKLHSVDDLKTKLAPFLMELHVQLAQDSDKLKEEISCELEDCGLATAHTDRVSQEMRLGVAAAPVACYF